ncbi:TRAP transporter substrate-binding protein DctP [Oscillatoria sp. CS-180]|uniref:TRAP transporter substrate-binding protein n=1 Tax=Oscillatoria sp. CS-180 TaxID=3021720 RepID=UPI00232CC43B|nr:TRAP transporter substrate-binding protein DctP [Oscillatoria sp. CS-180]MDB9525285.1 TRAP transporter substrate-binding protein DctP [Oscillatoria sp. CS-180]
MKRRKLLNQVALGAAGAGVLGACSRSDQFYKGGEGSSASQPLVEWRLASSWSEDTPRTQAMQRLSDLVREVTNDKFQITVFPEGSIAPKQEILQAVESGSAESGFTLGHYYLDRSPVMSFDATMPFGLDENQYEIWLYGAGGIEMLRKAYADFNIVNFPAGETGKQMGGWYKQKIQSLSDLQGLKMRFNGLGGKVFERLGVELVKLALSEIRPAMERGQIDAAEISSPFEDELTGIAEVAPYYYYPGWQQPRSTLSLYVNKAAWESLPKSYQTAIDMATAITYREMKALSSSSNAAALQRLKSNNVELLALPADILNAAQETTNELLQEYANQDAAFREIYDHATAFFEEYSTWTGLTA